MTLINQSNTLDKKMKVQIKGVHLPSAYVGSKSYQFSKGSQGSVVPELADLGDWKCQGEMWVMISRDNREIILEAVRQWISDKQPITFDIDHSWKAVAETQQANQDAYAKSTLKLKTDWQNDPRYGFAE